jgi:adenylyltransferase/sulfurtransferase
MNRYHRQILLPQIGEKGQRALAASRVLLIGVGALGTVIADQLVRAGVGFLRIIDRDLVELTNLQRQMLFDESDAKQNLPKAIAAANRLRAVNSEVKLDPIIADVDAGNFEDFIEKSDLILDGTDNVATRYLINDVSVKHKIPWIYGAAVATEGRVMTILPGKTPCLRCVFPDAPSPGELPTCDTAGVLGSVSSVVASIQSVEAIKVLSGNAQAISQEMRVLDLWTNRLRAVSLDDARRTDCPCCGKHQYEFLKSNHTSITSLCGRDAIQIRGGRGRLDLDQLQQQLQKSGELTRTPYFLRIRLSDPKDVELTVFPDARTIVKGTTDAGRARAIFSRFIGD